MIGRFDVEKIQCCLCWGTGKDRKNRKNAASAAGQNMLKDALVAERFWPSRSFVPKITKEYINV